MKASALWFSFIWPKTGSTVWLRSLYRSRPRRVSILRSIRSRALMFLGIRPRGGGASRIALRCFQSLVVAIRYSQSAVSVAMLSSDQ